VANHRTGLLIIRAWIEEGSEDPLRAQIRVTDDLATDFARSVTLVQADTVTELVESWLESMLSPATA
jgi:hypothetical protein